jgi:hypothetical protein
MIVNRNFVAKCAGCNEPLSLYEYKGLEGGIYGPPHTCPQLAEILLHDDAEAPLFYDLTEVSRDALPSLA